MSEPLDGATLAAMRRDAERHKREGGHGCESCLDNVLRLLDMVQAAAGCDVCRGQVWCPICEDRRDEARQRWERRIGGTDVAAEHAWIDVDERGVVQVEESLLAQLLTDAGWERTA